MRDVKQDSTNTMTAPKARVVVEDGENERKKAAYDAALLEEFDGQINEIVDNFDRPYDASKEQQPQLAIYHPSFQIAQKACEQVAVEAVCRFKTSNYTDSETAQIVQNFEEKGKIVYRSNQKIGLIGDSGVGRFNPSVRIASITELLQAKAR